MARNRYGWQKRAKELARKQKNDDKMKRRQGKILTPEGEEIPESSEEGMEGWKAWTNRSRPTRLKATSSSVQSRKTDQGQLSR